MWCLRPEIRADKAMSAPTTSTRPKETIKELMDRSVSAPLRKLLPARMPPFRTSFEGVHEERQKGLDAMLRIEREMLGIDDEEKKDASKSNDDPAVLQFH
jgi:hypothetical protein